MKTNYIKLMTIVGLSLLSGLAFGQKTSKYKKKTAPQFGFGITAGAVYSFQSGYEYDEDVKETVGIAAGAFANYSVSDKLKLQLSAIYNQYGTDFMFDDETFQEKQTYVSLPFTVKAYLSESIYLTVGPQLNILLNSTFDDEDIKEITQKTDFGLTGGLGFNFTKNIGLDLNYYYGLSNVYTADSEIDGNIIYNAASAKLFYEF